MGIKNLIYVVHTHYDKVQTHYDKVVYLFSAKYAFLS